MFQWKLLYNSPGQMESIEFQFRLENTLKTDNILVVRIIASPKEVWKRSTFCLEIIITINMCWAVTMDKQYLKCFSKSILLIFLITHMSIIIIITFEIRNKDHLLNIINLKADIKTQVVGPQSPHSKPLICTCPQIFPQRNIF